ncbi:peptide chain release factor N(5)-glutamine methyltransferase [Acidocella sp. KAb 2-4]|uniref:peptide chain release factor N(5)-glutamine methyltransferase n=1 Tax=Acidocella sp. KAb 2-4 TaxID=2885158 RepID=UPI001D08EF86|nr:peptide chain release factor N(5)-glutamine methyltransferase [Acidocella sp. KAb 2-4]MCB5945955.1 peptide chain release factor N(5)-glutamine methyltransferase [Acidocella sp. KAb 2-4]
MIRTSDALAEITARLREAGIDEPRREARLLLAAALGVSTGGLLARDNVDQAAYAPLLARRAAREPLAYITGHKEFWGLDFLVSPATLIPRPDTETLVEAVLDAKLQPRRVLDLGTGTGCLLLAVLHETPGAWGVGVDLNPEAAALAARNAERLGLGQRAAFLAGSWADALDAKFDLVLTNPPYIESADIPGLMPEVAGYEPARALDGGASGLEAYRAIIAVLPRILAENGLAVLELGADQAPFIWALAEAAGFTCATRRDLAGIERAALLRFRK